MFWARSQLVGSCNISQILSPVRLGLGLGRAQMGNKMYFITEKAEAMPPVLGSRLSPLGGLVKIKLNINCRSAFKTKCCTNSRW